MKKNKILIIVIIILSSLVLGLGGYIIYDNFFIEKDSTVDNENETVKDNNDDNVNETMKNENIFTDYCGALGWIAYVSSFDNNGEIKKDFDFFSDHYNKTLFVMEYILYRDGLDNFVKIVTDENPAYGLELYSYDDFNINYFNIFGENYAKDSLEIVNGKEYVVYRNRHHGSNGIVAEKINIIDIVNEGDIYNASVEIVYSEISNIKKINASIEYKKDGDKIIFKSFIVN